VVREKERNEEKERTHAFPFVPSFHLSLSLSFSGIRNLCGWKTVTLTYLMVLGKGEGGRKERVFGSYSKG
jgi:hypothetical protein